MGQREVLEQTKKEVAERLCSFGLASVSVGGATNERMLIFRTGRQTNKRSAGLTRKHTGKHKPNYISHGETALFTPQNCILFMVEKPVPQLQPF